MKTGNLGNFSNFIWKHLFQSLFFYTVASLGNFINKETLGQVFSCEFREISKNTFFTEHVWATASGSLTMIKDGKISAGKDTTSM